MIIDLRFEVGSEFYTISQVNKDKWYIRRYKVTEISIKDNKIIYSGISDDNECNTIPENDALFLEDVIDYINILL